MEIFWFILGTFFGSFYNVLIYRIPLGLDYIKGNSKCPKCNQKLKAVDLVPVFSWLLLKRKCRYCKEKIHWYYPTIEIIVGIIFAATYRYTGFNWMLLTYLSFFSMIIITFLIDYVHLVVSVDVLLIFSTISLLGIVLEKLAGYNSSDTVILYILKSLKDNFFGAIYGFLFFYSIYFLAKIIYRKEAFGFGDVLLLCAMGVVLGVKSTLMTAMLSFYIALAYYLISLIAGKKIALKQEIPFGPHMCTAAIIVLFYGQDIERYFLNYIF